MERERKLSRGARRTVILYGADMTMRAGDRRTNLKENLPVNRTQKKGMRSDKKQRNASDEKETKRAEIGTRGEKKMEKE